MEDALIDYNATAIYNEFLSSLHNSKIDTNSPPNPFEGYCMDNFCYIKDNVDNNSSQEEYEKSIKMHKESIEITSLLKTYREQGGKGICPYSSLSAVKEWINNVNKDMTDIPPVSANFELIKEDIPYTEVCKDINKVINNINNSRFQKKFSSGEFTLKKDGIISHNDDGTVTVSEESENFFTNDEEVDSCQENQEDILEETTIDWLGVSKSN